MNSLASPVGPRIQTRHFSGEAIEEADLKFSPGESLLAHVAPLVGAVNIWEVTTGRHLLQLDVVPGCTVAFSADNRLLAACGEEGGSVWELPSGNCVCSYAWPNTRGERPAYLAFTAEDAELMVAFGNRIFVIDTRSGLESRSYSFAKPSRYTLLSLNRINGSLHVCYVEQYPSDDGHSLYLSDALTGGLLLRVQMAPEDVPFVPLRGRIAVIWRHQFGHAEVWDLRAGQRLRDIPLPGLWHTLRFGPEDRFLAQAYEPPRARSAPREGCVLEVWDLLAGERVRSFDNIMSWDLEWSLQSGLMAISNHFEYAQPPVRNLTLFLDPFVGEVCGHTYGHRGHNEDTYCFSPSGRWLASAFTRDYVSNEGTTIPAGTVALTDLSPILLERPSISLTRLSPQP